MSVAYKGTKNDLTCRNHKFEVGKDYTVDGDIKLCGHGFHACEQPISVFDFYPPSDSRYFEVCQSGDTKSDEIKTVSKSIKINAEIGIIGLIKAQVSYVLSRIDKKKKPSKRRYRSAATNTGYQSAATNTGCRSAATNTGYRSAATNTGCRSAATNTGYRSAATNTGEQSAATNTGDRSAATNTGYQSAATNTGEQSAATNTGEQSAATNTGYQSAATNTGDRSAATNTGYQSAATNTGCRSAATNTGYRSAATNTGEQSAATVSGKYSHAIALGIESRARVDHDDAWIVICDWQRDDGGDWILRKTHTAKPGMKISGVLITKYVWYWFEKGKLKSEECAP